MSLTMTQEVVEYVRSSEIWWSQSAIVVCELRGKVYKTCESMSFPFLSSEGSAEKQGGMMVSSKERSHFVSTLYRTTL